MREFLGLLDTISKTKVAAPQTGCGVYFLYQGEDVVYVGQSVTIASRVGWHTEEKAFDSYAWIAVPEELLDAVERHYIELLKPPLNKLNQRASTERKHLTNAMVSAMTSKRDDSWIWDTEVVGLGVRHAKRGLRFYIRYRNNSGKQRKLKIGDASKTTVIEARYLAIQALHQAAAGNEVSTYKKSPRTERKVWLG